MEQEQPVRVGRRLAAIVAADVAGYSRLMGLGLHGKTCGRARCKARPVYPPIADMRSDSRYFGSGHVWTAPDWQGLSSRLQHWSEQPCVRPVCAVHMTAGHNALRGSGPGQNLAFHDAVALDCMSPPQMRRLTLDVATRVTRMSRAEPQTRRASRGSSYRSLCRNRHVQNRVMQ